MFKVPCFFFLVGEDEVLVFFLYWLEAGGAGGEPANNFFESLTCVFKYPDASYGCGNVFEVLFYAGNEFYVAFEF